MSFPDLSPFFDHTAAASILRAISAGGSIGEDEDLPVEFAKYADASDADGLSLQLTVLDQWREVGEEVGGWKIGSVARFGRAMSFGYILENRIVESGSRIDASSIPGAALEPEVAVTFGRQLTGHVSVDEARSAVSSISPAFEICSFRLPESAPRAIRIADAMSNWGLLLGPAQSPDIDLAGIDVQMSRDGELIGSSGANVDLLVHAYESLASAAEVLGERGLYFAPGQHVTLGSMLPAVSIGEASECSATYGQLGSITLRTR